MCERERQHTIGFADQKSWYTGEDLSKPDPFSDHVLHDEDVEPVKIFKHALRHWPDFMDCVKLELETAWLIRKAGHVVTLEDALEDHNLVSAYNLRDVDLEQYRRDGKWWTWRRPHLPLLRRFQHVAVAIWEGP